MKRSLFIVASRNQHKVAEIRAMIGEVADVWSLDQMPGAPEVEEDGSTFEANATKKGLSLARWLKQQPVHSFPLISDFTEAWILADDSGLEVDALNGAPGVHSARFASIDDFSQAGNAPDVDNNAKLIRLLDKVPEESRTGRFRCVIALVDVDKDTTRIFEGVCPGRLNVKSSGEGGFGYDPLFVPDGFDRTFAELGEDIKNSISHRAKALQAMRDGLR